MTADVALGGGREFDLVRRMSARWGPLAVGLGDDAAAVAVPRGEQLLVSVDTAREGTHFRREWLSLEQAAFRGVTAALSDLAAMAARPLGILVALELPSLGDDEVDALADGIGAAARAAGTVIRGGNVADGLAIGITTTVLGSAYAPLARSGARVGDRVYVTGSLGGPAAAVRTLERGGAPPPACLARFVAPVARMREAAWLATRGATACIDISDGLGGDAGHLSAASGCALEVDLQRVPLVTGAEPGDVGGGEEYELLLTSRAPLPVEEFAQRFGIPLTEVGIVRAGGETVFTRGTRRVATPRGYDHLSR